MQCNAGSSLTSLSPQILRLRLRELIHDIGLSCPERRDVVSRLYRAKKWRCLELTGLKGEMQFLLTCLVAVLSLVGESESERFTNNNCSRYDSLESPQMNLFWVNHWLITSLKGEMQSLLTCCFVAALSLVEGLNPGDQSDVEEEEQERLFG